MRKILLEWSPLILFVILEVIEILRINPLTSEEFFEYSKKRENEEKLARCRRPPAQ